MSIDILSLNTEPTSEDWVELSMWGDWRDLLTEQDMDVSHKYSDDVRRMASALRGGVSAGLGEFGGMLLIGTVRDAMRLAVCVLRLEEINVLRRVGEHAWTQGPSY